MKKYKFLSILLLFVVMGGCSGDFLETKSTESIDENAVFANTKTAMMAVDGLHKLMWTPDLHSSAYYGGYDMLMIWFDMLGDDLMFTYANAQFQSQAKWYTHRRGTIASMLHFYRLLQYFVVNSRVLIERTDGLEGTQDERNNIKGQAYFYHAFGLFAMVQMYGERYYKGGNNTQPGIVMRDDDADVPKARSTVEEVYARINEDLDEAIRLLAATTVPRPNKSHINVHVARGLKARVLLAQGKWAEAAAMAKLVVDQSGARLQDNTYTTPAPRFTDQSNTEWIWGSMPLLAQGEQLTHFQGYMSNEAVSYNRNSPRAINNLLYNRISSTDVRKGTWFPEAVDVTVLPRPIVASGSGGRYANYMANKYLVTDPTTYGARDIPFMRLPEMMLIMAEGYARAGEDSKAADALYPLAHHRDPQYVKSAKTGDDLIDEVMFQRRVELWGEGFRFFDLKRLNVPLDRGPKPRPGYNQGKWGTPMSVQTNLDPEASNYNMYGDGTVMDENYRNVPANSIDWQWAIPELEIQLNPLCEPNP